MAADDGGTVSLKSWIYQHAFESWLPPVNASLAFALAFRPGLDRHHVGMHRKGILIKV